jgi:N,N-dimethylformamidase
VRQGGALHWWRYLAGNGDPGPWANGGATKWINAGWDKGTLRELVACGSGTLYTVALDNASVPGPDHRLLWYRITNSETIDRDGSAHFANGNNGGIKVGEGFTVESMAALQGYPTALSVRAGQQLNFAVSTTFAAVTARPVRVAPNGPTEVGTPVSVAGRLKPLPSDFRSRGCGWSTDFTLQTASTWQSGVYAMRLSAPEGPRHHMLFVVRPATPAARLAFMLPTNTYNAYNN